MRNTRAAVVRRRRLATSTAVALTIAAVAFVLAQLPGHSHAHGDTAPKTNPTPSSSPPASLSATSRPTMHHVLRRYVAKRDGAIGIAVYDSVAKKLAVVHPGVRGWTASIVKADILETLLHHTDGHLSEDQRETATSMIEESNNDAATDLFDQDGGAPGLTAYNNDVGLQQTTPNDEWGLTRTSASDQVTLIRELFGSSTLLTPSAQHFQRYLMRHVTPSQRWGIGAGVPSSASFGNKNGWLPVDEDRDRWAVNSIGWVHGDQKRYVIAVITQHNDTEGYGIHTINHISQIVWRHVDAATSS